VSKHKLVKNDTVRAIDVNGILKHSHI